MIWFSNEFGTNWGALGEKVYFGDEKDNLITERTAVVI